jgi:hypothetical protein
MEKSEWLQIARVIEGRIVSRSPIVESGLQEEFVEQERGVHTRLNRNWSFTVARGDIVNLSFVKTLDSKWQCTYYGALSSRAGARTTTTG